ncbi:MAG TPA: M28 family peptidase [Candidatus Eisenbacteria bacterium]|nr:M28 family peptidase [Candidatus Eisenbacteria bacterium]
MRSTASSASRIPRFRIPGPLRTALRAGFVTILLGFTSCDRPAAAFEGKRAFGWLKQQCDFGPRVPGTAAHDTCFAFLVKTLQGYASEVEADTFYYDSPILNSRVRLMNVVARFRPELRQRVLFGAHWDTRPWADRDPEPAKRRLPVLGANDGASGVAVLLELARLLQKSGPLVGVDIVLFDGEDLGTQADPNGYFRGSNRYVEESSGQKPPLFVVVLDMVGKKDLDLHWEGNSRKLASNIVDLVWGQANDLGIRSFRSDVRHTVFDDHMPFLNAGIPAIDVIDFDYPQWHTTHDTPDKCSPESLEGVGQVLLTLVRKPNFLSN